MIENEMNVTVHLEIIKASEIEPKEVKWLWYPYIPFGKKKDASRLWYGEYEGNAVLSKPCDRSAGTAGFLICKTTMI